MKFEIPNQGKIIGYFGEDNQLLYCKEQLEEMIHAVSEMRRIKISGENSSEAYENLVEGFADVLICLAQLQEIYEIPNHMIQNLIYRRSSEQENWIVDMPDWN